jgi:hypothetical protein
MSSEHLHAKVQGFVPGVDMVDGMSDIETAHYFIQIYADGDVYTIRRTAVAFLELDKDLAHRFPKLPLPLLPLYDLDGAAALKKYKREPKKKRCDLSLPIDELMRCQPELTAYVCQLMLMDAVLACEEMRAFLTELSNSAREADDDDDKGGTVTDLKLKLIIDRFGKGKSGDESLEHLLLDGLPVLKQKVYPSQAHSVTLPVTEAGSVLVWGFTTLPGNAAPAKDIAFSVTFNGQTIKPYERLNKVQSELVKGCWHCPAPGSAVLTWHNDYSKWYKKNLAYKACVTTPTQFADAQKRLRKATDAKAEREDQSKALTRAIIAETSDLFGDLDRNSSVSTVTPSADLFDEPRASTTGGPEPLREPLRALQPDHSAEVESLRTEVRDRTLLFSYLSPLLEHT